MSSKELAEISSGYKHLDIGYFLPARRSLGGGWLAIGYSKMG